MPVYSPFDINTVSCPVPQSAEAEVRVRRQNINRMVALIGNIPFSEYFDETIATVAQRVLKNLDAIPPNFDPLIGNRQGVSEAIMSLADVSYSFSDVLEDPDDPISREISQILRSLEGYGIYFPSLTDDAENNGDKAEALYRLLEIEDARELSYRSIFEIAKSDVSAEAAYSVIAAIQLGVLPPYTNDCIYVEGASPPCQYRPACNCNGAISTSGQRDVSVVTIH